MSDPIKRGDAAELKWDLDPAPEDGSTVRVIVRAPGQAAVVSRDAELAGARVTITLTPDDTATAGTYNVEFETTPPGEDGGPVTYPNTGYDTLIIEPDLG